MTISSGGLNVNLNPTPTIYEKQTTAEADLKNTGEMGKGSAVIVSNSQSDLIPLTQMAARNTWDYKSESKAPMLDHPIGQMRGAGNENIASNEGKKAYFETLYNLVSQDEDMKVMLAGIPTSNTVLLKMLMDLAANALNAQSKAEIISQNENALARTAENKKLPDIAYSRSLDIGKEIMKRLDAWIEKIGANDPNYLETKEFITEVYTHLNETSHHE